MPRMFYKIVALALGSLGLACGKGVEPTEHGPPPEPILEYGMPQASYVLAGRVLKSTDLSPLAGIEVTFKTGSDTTGPAGTFSLDLRDTPCGQDGWPACSLYVADIDGTDNGGLFADKSIPLNLTQTDPGDGSWDRGTFEQEDIDIHMDKEQ